MQPPSSSELVRELTERYTPDIAVPTPAVLAQVRRNVAFRLELLRVYGGLTPAQVADLHGSSARNRGALVDNWRRASRAFTVTLHGRTLVPGFQITNDGSPHPVLATLLPVLRRIPGSDWSLAAWFTSPNAYFDWAKPADILAARPDAPVTAEDDVGRVMVEAAEDHAAPGMGFGGANPQPQHEGAADVVEPVAAAAEDLAPDHVLARVEQTLAGDKKLTRAEVARRLHVPVDVVSRWAEAGMLRPAAGAAEPLEFSEADVLEFLDTLSGDVRNPATSGDTPTAYAE